MSKEIKGVVNRLDLFTTPLWYVERDLPEGAYEWALDIEKNVEGREVSNKGGAYQSQELEFEKIPYFKLIQEMTAFLPSFHFGNPWLNINRKGHYNIKHTHPSSDLAAVWYITDNMDKLFFEDPCYHARSLLLEKSGGDEIKSLDIKAGTLIMFPSDVSHWVEMNETDSPRISLSFNINLEG